jgi:hypothetical protein
MYYKLYRRRRTIYIIIIVSTLLLFFLSKNNTFSSNLTDHKSKKHPKYRYNYPDPCINCPGENGKPVFLSVCLYIFYLVGYNKYSIFFYFLIFTLTYRMKNQ